MKTFDSIEKCMCDQCKSLNDCYSIYQINNNGGIQPIVSGIKGKRPAIEWQKKYHANGHFDVYIIEGNLDCKHRVSNKEIDYVIERIMNKSYLFAPPCGTWKGRKINFGFPSIYDAKSQKSISYSAHSQSPRRIYAKCQRCNHGSHYVYLDRVYERMVKRGLIEDYPEVEEVADGKHFPKYYLIVE